MGGEWGTRYLISINMFQDFWTPKEKKIFLPCGPKQYRKSNIERAAIQFCFMFICTGTENKQQGIPEVLKH